MFCVLFMIINSVYIRYPDIFQVFVDHLLYVGQKLAVVKNLNAKVFFGFQ